MITKMTLRKDILKVWTKELPEIGFNFRIDDIIDKVDLIKKVQSRVDEEIAKENIETQRQTKFESLK